MKRHRHQWERTRELVPAATRGQWAETFRCSCGAVRAVTPRSDTTLEPGAAHFVRTDPATVEVDP